MRLQFWWRSGWIIYVDMFNVRRLEVSIFVRCWGPSKITVQYLNVHIFWAIRFNALLAQRPKSLARVIVDSKQTLDASMLIIASATPMILLSYYCFFIVSVSLIWLLRDKHSAVRRYCRPEQSQRLTCEIVMSLACNRSHDLSSRMKEMVIVFSRIQIDNSPFWKSMRFSHNIRMDLMVWDAVCR